MAAKVKKALVQLLLLFFCWLLLLVSLGFILLLSSLQARRRKELLWYLLYCLIPAVCCGVLLGYYYAQRIKIHIAASMVMAILLASGTMVHYAVSGRRSSHLLYVIFQLVSVIGLTHLFLEIKRGTWIPLFAAILGALLGSVVGTGLYAFLQQMFECH